RSPTDAYGHGPAGPYSRVLGLQHAVGNGAVSRLLQAGRASGNGGSALPASVRSVLNSSGQPLDPATRGFMEARFGQELGDVRLHTDTRAAESARDVHALAYTVGQDVVLGASTDGATSQRGRVLLAHELAHTIQ